MGGSSRKGYVNMHIYLPNFQLKVELSDSSMVMEEKLYRKWHVWFQKGYRLAYYRKFSLIKRDNHDWVWRVTVATG